MQFITLAKVHVTARDKPFQFQALGQAGFRKTRFLKSPTHLVFWVLTVLLGFWASLGFWIFFI